MGKFHCPRCGRYVSNVLAEEYGKLQGTDTFYPYYKWHVMGDCKTHGRLEIEDHDGEDGCGCWSVNMWECWFSESMDERLHDAISSQQRGQ